MSEESLQLARGAFEHFAKTGEPQWETIDPEVECYDHDIPDAGTYRGHEGYLSWIADWGEAWEDWGFEPEHFIEAGDQVVMVTRLWARGKGSGVRTERRDGWIFTVRNGRAVRIDYYSSKAEALEAVGLSE